MCAFDSFLRFWLIFAVFFKILVHVLHVSLLFCHVSLCVFCFFCKFLVDFKTCSLFCSDLSLFFRIHVFFDTFSFFGKRCLFFRFFLFLVCLFCCIVFRVFWHVLVFFFGHAFIFSVLFLNIFRFF